MKLGVLIRSEKFLVLCLLLSFAIIMVNQIALGVMFVGITASLVYILLGGHVLGTILFKDEQLIVGWPVGLLLLLGIMSFVTWLLVIFGFMIGIVESMAILLVTSLFIVLIMVGRRMKGNRQVNEKPQSLNSSSTVGGKNRNSEDRSFKFMLSRQVTSSGAMVYLSSFYLVLWAFMMYLLIESRTPTTDSIWTIFNASYLGIFFAMTLTLLILIAIKGNSHLKLSLIILHSSISHIFWVVLYEGRMGFDYWIGAWVGLGAYSGECLSWTLFSPRPFLVTIFHAGQMVLSPYGSALLARMFYVDVYWIHLLFVPLLWSIFVPIIAFGISRLLCKDDRISLVAALLTMSIPSLISWGARTVSNSFALLLYFFLIYLVLRYLSGKGRFILVAFVTLLVLLEHALVGVLSLSIVMFVYFYRRYQNGETTRVGGVLFLFVFLCNILVLPLSLYARAWTTYPQIGGSFSLQPLQQLSGYEAVFTLIFGGYTTMAFGQAFVMGIVPLLGLIGLIYVVLSKKEHNYHKKLSRFILMIFVFIMIEYEITDNFMINIPFSRERIWALRDFLAILFFLVVVENVISFFSRKETSRKVIKYSAGLPSVNGLLIKAAVFLSVAALITATIYVAYPEGSWVNVSGYELDAVKYIEATTNETYVVIAPGSVTWAGSSIVGLANPRAFYSPAYSPPPGYAPSVPRRGKGSLLQIYYDIIKNPSIRYIYDAKKINNASVVYVILTKSKIGLEPDHVISSMAEMPFTELYGVYGNETYVFASRPPFEPITGGEGPAVYIYNLDEYVNTTYTYDITTSQASYTLVLEDALYYNLTEWLAHWSFEEIEPTPPSQQIDANSWINFTAFSANQTYLVRWTANEIYRSIGWRDDSFTTGWKEYLVYGHWLEDKPPTATADGDVLTFTGFFEKGRRGVYLLTKTLENISTNEYPYFLIKWRSTNPIAFANIELSDGTYEKALPWASHSPTWAFTIKKLPSDKYVQTIIIGLDNFVKGEDIEGEQILQFDLIFLAEK